MEQELVSGTIAAVVFENPENGYAVGKLDSDDGGLMNKNSNNYYYYIDDGIGFRYNTNKEIDGRNQNE